MQLSIAAVLALAASVSALYNNVQDFKDNIATISRRNVENEVLSVVTDGTNLKNNGASDLVEIFKFLNTPAYVNKLKKIVNVYGRYMDKVNSIDLYNYVASDVRRLRIALDALGKRAGPKNIVQIPNMNYKNLINEHGVQFFVILNDTDLFKRMPSSFFEAVARLDYETQLEYCSVIEKDSIEALNKDNVRSLPAPCFAGIQDPETIASDNFVQLVPSLNKNIFSYHNDALSEQVLKKITSEQLSNFGANRGDDQEKVCANLDLSKVSEKAIKGVRIDCLASYLMAYNGVDGAQRKLGKLWKNIPATIFENLDEDMFTVKELAKAFAADDKQYMSADLLKNLYKDKRMAKNMTPSSSRLTKKGFTITADIAAKTKDPQVLATALSNTAELDVNFLAALDAEYFQKLSLQYTPTAKYEGLEILNLLKSSNKAAVVKNLSAAVEYPSKHACSTIESLESFRKIKVLFDNASDECLAALEFGVGMAEVKKFPKLAVGRTDMFNMFSDDQDLAKLTLPIMTSLSKSDFCAKATLEKIRKINKNAIPGITGDCIGKISFSLGEFKSEETTRFADSAFSKVSNDTWKLSRFDFSYVNDAQLSQLSVDIKAADMITSNLTVEALQALDKRIAFLVSKQVSAMPKDLLLALPMPVVTADALDNLSAKQITEIAPKLKEMSAEQIEKIGSKQSDQKAIVEALLKEEKSLSGAALAALKTRASAFSKVNSAATLTASTAILAALTAAAYLF